MKKLNNKEVEAVRCAIAGKPLKDKRKDFEAAATKLRWCTYEKDLPENKSDCDYSEKWMRSHTEEASDLLNRHQRGCDAAWSVFWDHRRGA